VQDGDPNGQLRDVGVLVVDDDPDSNEAVATLLCMAGAEVRVASSAEEAMEILERWTPRIIVSDIGMPVTDGYAFVSQVRALHGQQIPAIALTAFASTEARIRAFSAGFQGHLAKPVEPDELIALMEALLR
jgi:CheY-like chemotaxis protein